MSLRLLAVLCVALTFCTQVSAQDAKPIVRPDVEVVFCLDTTGSMGGLIQAAKQKIWAISNQIASGRPTPRLKVGLVAYRDRQDAYVTQLVDLTEDLDAIHAKLQGLAAAGGGDFPESVNQALDEAVTKMTWSKDAKTLKLIFLVGDAPPHMDYANDVKYPDSCKKAAASGIIINTVQCGVHAETKKYWQDICRLAEGSYVQIDQAGGPLVAVATPFDKDLAEINREMSKNTLVFGRQAAQSEMRKNATLGAGLAPAAAADRAGYLARNGAAGSYDLLENIKKCKVKLADLKKEELPDELKNLTPAEQKTYLDKLDKTRQELQTKALELDKKRSEFIAKKAAEDEKNRGRDSFDQNVLRILQRQAQRANIEYAVEEKK